MTVWVVVISNQSINFLIQVIAGILGHYDHIQSRTFNKTRLSLLDYNSGLYKRPADYIFRCNPNTDQAKDNVIGKYFLQLKE